MCQFKSFIVTKNGDVLWTENESHEAIIEKYKNSYDLTDDTQDPEKMKFARVEIIPPNGNIFEKDFKKWVLSIDQTITPKWWGKELEKSCFKELKQFAKNHIYQDKNFDILEDRKYLFMRNCKINKVKNSLINVLRENSEVGVLWGNSKVGVLWGNSKVGVLRENSEVGVLRENSEVGVLWGNSKVGVLWGNSKVGVLWGNSKVGVLRENSKVGVLRENSKVGVLRENSQANIFNSTAMVLKINDSALAIIRFKDVVEIVCANKDIKITVKDSVNV